MSTRTSQERDDLRRADEALRARLRRKRKIRRLHQRIAKAQARRHR